jgi:hypothetical protein
MKRLAILSLVSSLAACAGSQSNPWVNPDLPREYWERDYAVCRRMADRDVGWREDDGPGGSPMRDYDRQKAKQRFDAVVASCMTDRGYVPASRLKTKG